MPNAVPSTTAVAGVVMLLAVPTLAAPAEPLDAARDRALAWLIRGQQADGSWRKQDNVAVQSTARVLDAFARFGVKGVAADRGVSWLANAPANNHDALSHSIGTLGERGLNVSRPLAELMQGDDIRVISSHLFPECNQHWLQHITVLFLAGESERGYWSVNVIDAILVGLPAWLPQIIGVH